MVQSGRPSRRADSASPSLLLALRIAARVGFADN